MKMRGFFIVLFLAGLIYFVLWMVKGGKEKLVRDINTIDRTQVELTKANMTSLQKAIISFTVQRDRTPNNLKELRLVVVSPFGYSDAWGTPFKYKKLSEDKFRLISASADKTFGTSDDIVVDY
ncbi:MAG: type II secretion system protein GspG [Candidatus Aminicenantes bacterium]|nr:type II secretion system protein GspG [Candidatus Aminicenantes bacterium]